MRSNDLTEGGILGKLLQFFFPVLFGMLFQQLYNTVDAVVVGRCVGPDALAAVGGSPAVLINLVIGFFTGVASGATVIISQHFGSRDYEQLREAEHTILLFCVLAGAALMALGWFTTPWALRVVKTPADIFAASQEYLRIYYLGAIPLLLFNVGSGILRAVGDSRRPLIFLGVCCVLNIALDLLFVAALGMEVAGVALATVLSMVVSAVCVLSHLARAEEAYRLRLSALRIAPRALRRILYIGIPAGVQGALYAVSNIVIQSAVNDFGTTVVAAWTAISKFDGVFWVTSNSFGMTICTFVGQCFGAGRYERMKTGVRRWLLTALGVSVVLAGALLSLGPWAMHIFTDDAAVLRQAMQLLWYFVPFYPFWSFIEIYSNTLRGAGDALPPTIICLIGVCLLRVLWVWFVVPYWHTMLAVSISYPITWFITALVFVLYYYRGHWLERCMAPHRPARPAELKQEGSNG